MVQWAAHPAKRSLPRASACAGPAATRCLRVVVGHICMHAVVRHVGSKELAGHAAGMHARAAAAAVREPVCVSLMVPLVQFPFS